MSLSKIESVVRDLAGMYGRPMEDSAVRLWALSWLPYDAERLEQAVAAGASEWRYMPTVAAAREKVAHLYPTRLAEQVMAEWISRGHPWGSVPSQVWIDDQLVVCGYKEGMVERKHLIRG